MSRKVVRLIGDEELVQNLRKLARKYPRAAAAAVYEQSQIVLGRAVEKTPVETGDLRKSAYATPPRGMGMKTSIGFWRRYALPVHERVEVFHQVGGPLFLRKAMEESAGTWEAEMAMKIKRNVKENRGVETVSRSYDTEPREDGES